MTNKASIRIYLISLYNFVAAGREHICTDRLKGLRRRDHELGAASTRFGEIQNRHRIVEKNIFHKCATQMSKM